MRAAERTNSSMIYTKQQQINDKCWMRMKKERPSANQFITREIIAARMSAEEQNEVNKNCFNFSFAIF
jgi:hypothetical protein